MKTFTSIFLFLTIIIFTSCEGPMGPPGYDGEDGLDGTSLLGTVMETTVDFTAANDYSVLFEFPSNLEIYTTDIVMVYILWDQVNDNGETLDVWRALPQTILLEDGFIQYNFDHTVKDVQIFMRHTVPELLPGETENQTFRIAVLPATDVINKSIDIQDMDAVLKSLNLDKGSIKSVQVK